MCGWKGKQVQGFPHLFTFPGLVLSVFSNITTESWASLVAQIIKNLPATQEVQVQSLGWEDPLEKKMATHSSILAGESHGQRSLVGYSPRGCKESDTTERLHFHFSRLDLWPRM